MHGQEADIPAHTLTGVFGRDALSLYRQANRLSSILENIFSANGLAHDFSSMRFSRSVRPNKASFNVIC